jgi:pimeloyl-ACP methyl ester carboxylesterase
MPRAALTLWPASISISAASEIIATRRRAETVGEAAPIVDSYALPAAADPAILRDVAKVMSKAASAPVHAAGRELTASFEHPVLFAWGPEDRVFPLGLAAAIAD